MTPTLKFGCPLCGARPNKPCVEVEGPRKGKTRKVHEQRKKRAAGAGNKNPRGPKLLG